MAIPTHNEHIYTRYQDILFVFFKGRSLHFEEGFFC